MTDLSSELVHPLREARALLRAPSPAAIDRAIPLLSRVAQALSQLRDSGQPLPDGVRPAVEEARREIAAFSLLLDRAALLQSARLQSLTDRSRRDSAAAKVEI
jgi:hypothetical protein